MNSLGDRSAFINELLSKVRKRPVSLDAPSLPIGPKKYLEAGLGPVASRRRLRCVSRDKTLDAADYDEMITTLSLLKRSNLWGLGAANSKCGARINLCRANALTSGVTPV